MSLVCDTTGNNPLFRISDLRYHISKDSIGSTRVSFPQPAYLDSIVIKKLGSDGVVRLLVYEDYSFDGCRDSATEDMVKANVDRNFTKALYNGVLIPRSTFGTDNVMDLTIEFQSVFPNIINSAMDVASNEGGPTCTPELLRMIVQDLCYVKGMISGSASGSIVLLTAENIDFYKGRNYPICGTVSGTYVTRIVTQNDIGSYVNDPDETAGSFTYAKAYTLPSPLVTDYTGELADNYVEDEMHYVDTIGGKVIIRPSNGAFYGHDIVIRDKDNNILDASQYTARALDMGATKVCEHTSGVWRYIVLTLDNQYTGNLHISYHAFGGEVNISNFISLQNEFIELRNYINEGSFLTPSNLGGTPVMQEIYERLKTLDRYFRSLNLSGYREMSNRYLAVPQSSNNTSGWYRVAYLYKQASAAVNKETVQLLNDNYLKYVGRVLPLCATPTGSFVDTEIKPSHIGQYIIVNSATLDINDNNYFTTYTKDSVRLKLRLEKNGVFFDMYVYANVKSGVLKIHAVEADTENGYSSPNSYKSLANITLPQFRLVWRKDGNYTYGAVLQVKIQIPAGETNEVVVIENHNKAGMGGWVLKADNVGTDEVRPENDTVMLPDEIHTWIANGGDSYGVAECYPSFKNGTLIWAGSMNLNQYDVWDYTQTSNETKPSWKQGSVTPLHTCFVGDIDFASLDNITVTIFDRLDGVYRSFTSKVRAVNENQCSVEYEFDALDLSYLKLNFTKNNGALVITPEAILGTKSYYMEKFDLRQITMNKEMSE